MMIGLPLTAGFFTVFLALDFGSSDRLRREKTYRSPLAYEADRPLENFAARAPVSQKGVVPTFRNFVGKILGLGGKTSRAKPLQSEVFGFLPFWTLEKRAAFRYDLLSTIAYFGVDANAQGEFIKTLDNGKTDGGWASWNGQDFAEVIKSSRQFNIRVLLTIKGFDNETIEKLIACALCRTRLVENSLKEVKLKEINGVNLDFEYVGTPGDSAINNFTQLVQDFADAFHLEIPGSYVTVSAYARSAIDKKLHDVKAIAQIADSFFIMGYDFFRPNSTHAGPIAPLSGKEKYGYDLKTTVDDYLKLAPPEKIILGLPYYGYDWPVENNQANAKTLESSEINGYTNMSSYVNSQYDPLNTERSRNWDKEANVPYYSWFDESHQVWRQTYYEDVRSLGLKYDFIKSKKLRGVGIWALGYDGDRPELWDLLEEKFTKP